MQFSSLSLCSSLPADSTNVYRHSIDVRGGRASTDLHDRIKERAVEWSAVADIGNAPRRSQQRRGPSKLAKEPGGGAQSRTRECRESSETPRRQAGACDRGG